MFADGETNATSRGERGAGVSHHNPDGWTAGEAELGDADELAKARTAALGVTLDHVAHGVVEAATRFLWLDYSYANADVAAAHLPCVFALPIGASSFQRDLRFSAEAMAEADNDARMLPEMQVVHIGGVEVRRREEVLDTLRDAGVKGYVVEGFFGARRARLLARVAVGLNIHRNEGRQVAEVARLMAYLACGVPTVSEAGTDERLEAELSLAVDFVPHEGLGARVLELLAEDPDARAARGERARAVARGRETKAMLARSLGAVLPACRERLAPHLRGS